MALFSLTDISFRAPETGRAGTNQLTKNNAYKVRRYPEDLGAADKGHYMVIHINEQRRTQFKGKEGPDKPTVIENRLRSPELAGLSGAFGNVGNFVGQVSKGLESLVGLTDGSLSNIISQNLSSDRASDEDFQVSFLRTIKRTTETIALYMPDTLVFDERQTFNTMEMGGKNALLLTGASGVIDMANEIKNTGNAPDAIARLAKNLTPFIIGQLAQATDITKIGYAALTGTVQNPMIEMMYSSPQQRSFQFEFMFYPRSEKEAYEVQSIINSLRFHQAPEILRESQGLFLVPPSEFDIKFYYNGRENPNIPPISTSVLQSMAVDYAPNGFSAYESGNLSSPSHGGTGMPVAIRLSLNFTETEIMTKQHHRYNYLESRQDNRFGLGIGGI